MDAQEDEALTISERIKPLLAAHGLPLQGAVLADLVSVWLAGHRPAIRDAVLENMVVTIKQLVPLSAMEIIADRQFKGH